MLYILLFVVSKILFILLISDAVVIVDHPLFIYKTLKPISMVLHI